MRKETKVRYKEANSSLQIQILLILTIFFAFIILLLTFLIFSSKQRFELQTTVHQRSSTNNTSIINSQQYLRLPTTIYPLHYDLKLQIYLPYREGLNFNERNFSIHADVAIRVICLHATDRIILNAKSLKFDESDVEVQNSYNESMPLISINRYQHEVNNIHVVEIVLMQELDSGHDYMIYIRYQGIINDVWSGGFYKTQYNINGETRLLALTQLQPTDASRLFPCFDEPEMKATFKISIIHPMGTSAVSNSPVRHFRHLNSKWSKTEFGVTPTMSTYLLAIAVSDFVFKFRHCGKIEIRVWCQSAMVYDIDYALRITCRLLIYYENFFSIPYPLKKLDIFTVPELRVLAMENWGLITVRQKLVLYNQRLNSLRERRVVTDVIAHEVAHMWFGNLATMRWWNDLWLNEGFATMMGQKAADFVENTTLRMSQCFAADITLKALSSDQHTTMTQPISLKENSDRIHGQDIKIIYNKGAAVIRMVESTIGKEVFRQGLNLYLVEFAYANAEKSDLLSSFSKIFKAIDHHHDPFFGTNFSVYDYIDSWIYQRGFPLLKVQQVGDYIEISQQIFDFDNNSEFANTQWKVPIFTRGNEQDEVHWLEEGKKLKLLHGSRTFVLDPNFHGYYRIQYELEYWKLLIDHLLYRHNYFSVSTRLKLLDDAFVLAETGRIPYAIPMKMSLYLRNETKVVPFITFLTRFETILYRVHRHSSASLFNKYMQFLMEPSFDRIIKAETDSNVPRNMEFEFIRELIYLKMCASGHQQCIRIFRSRLKELYKNCSQEILSNPCNSLEASLRNIAYMVASKYGNQAELTFMINKFHTEEYHVERDRIFSALASSSNRSYIEVLVKEVLIKKEKDTDFRPKLYELSRKNYDNGAVEQYLFNNFAELLKRHEKYGPFFMLQMARGYGTNEDLQKVKFR
ncbi:peptidase family M1 containing protein [Loa loa]|uniref:Aminopeptidase n=2 Tax=Loa loa TaxID=7209 RepID=A0A1S0UI31_LOALO|nr:peptidase family M1 containing protein [Loa loa]EJD74474.1 peptidase family M1 containing protein [Loa loa]